MVFSSLEFLLFFLPITILIYYAILKYTTASYALAFLLFASLFYYAFWNFSLAWVIVASVLCNFGFSYIIDRSNGTLKRFVYLTGLACNIGALCYFKYTNFFIENINAFTELQITSMNVVLPIGISFFTFQQIAYLSDRFKKATPTFNSHDTNQHTQFLDYCLFICFFPQLVAGPIVHHSEMMPQFADIKNQRIQWDNIYWGLALLACGLVKKVLIADNISPVVTATFDVRESLTFMEALLGSLAYTFQLYFDFSGYSDMAVGIGLFFNIQLPFNFFSPYKAKNIQDFWRRWHITLSRWLREYLYIPLGGNRNGDGRTLVNLFLTFLIGGIWHGAAWTFVAWGALHGLAVLVHRVWTKAGKKLHVVPAVILTFLFVNITWIFFRAPNFDRVSLFFDGFSGQNGFWYSRDYSKLLHDKGWVLLGLSFLLCFLVPSSKEFYEKKNPSTYFITPLTAILKGITHLLSKLILFIETKNTERCTQNKPSICLTVVITATLIGIIYHLIRLWCFYPEIEPDFIYFQF